MTKQRVWAWRPIAASLVGTMLAACVSGSSVAPPPRSPAAGNPAAPGDRAAAPVAGAGAPATTLPPSASRPAPAASAAPAATPAPAALAAAPAVTPATPSTAEQAALEAPDPVPFDASISRAGKGLFEQAVARLGAERRAIVIDPLIDANTGAQTVSTNAMGQQLAGIVGRSFPNWSIAPLTRQTLAERPLLLIGTLTPVNVQRAVDTTPDAFRVWLTLIDLRTGKVVAKKIDRSTVASVNNEPLPFYRDSPTWHKDRTIQAYINSCQVNTKVGDPADPEYLARLPAAALINEAILAYDKGTVPEAYKLYREAAPVADPGDLRVLNGLYVTSWRLGQREEAKDAFGKIVDSGLELKRLPIKLLFQPGKTAFNQVGDLTQQYQIWLAALAQGASKAATCVRIVGHTSRTGSARVNETLSRQRAEAVEAMLKQQNRALSNRISATGVGSREALIGLGTDDLRDALDRRVEFRVVDCV